MYFRQVIRAAMNSGMLSALLFSRNESEMLKLKGNGKRELNFWMERTQCKLWAIAHCQGHLRLGCVALWLPHHHTYTVVFLLLLNIIYRKAFITLSRKNLPVMAPDDLPKFVYKIVPAAPPEPLPTEYPLSVLDETDGFVHLSTAEQVSSAAELIAIFELYTHSQTGARHVRSVLQPRCRPLGAQARVCQGGGGDQVGGRVPASVRQLWCKRSCVDAQLQQGGDPEME